MIEVTIIEVFKMTKCIPKSIKLSSLNRKKVEINFEGGCITSSAGLLLLREMDNRLRLTEKVSKYINDNRKLDHIHHSCKTLLRQKVYAIPNGDANTNDQDNLRNDLCFQTCV